MKKTIATILMTIIITFSLTIGMVFCYEKLSWNTYDVSLTVGMISDKETHEYTITIVEEHKIKKYYGEGGLWEDSFTSGINGTSYYATLYWDLK